MIDTQRELLTTALDANLSLVSVQQNEHTKRLAAWAAMIAVPTMIVGIYGMNFRLMPELDWDVRLFHCAGRDVRRLRAPVRRLPSLGLAVVAPITNLTAKSRP